MKNHSDIKFYDTCALLQAGEKIFEGEEKFLISSITLKELERIKTSSNKDEDIKYSARLLLHLLDDFSEQYDTVIHCINYEDAIIAKGLDITDDTRILSDAIHCNNTNYADRIIFVTNDLSLKKIANLFFGDGNIESIPEDIDNYTGYSEVTLDAEALSEFYQNTAKNHFNLLPGEYLILKDNDG